MRLAGHGEEHCADLIGVGGVEERDVDFGAALAFEVDGEQVGPGGEEHPEDLAAIARIAHLRGDHGEDTGAGAGIAFLIAVAESGVGFVDDDDDGAEGAEEVEEAFEIAFGFAHIFRAEIAEGDHRDANFAGEALGEKTLTGADGAADEVAHGEGVQVALAEESGVVLEPLLDGLVADPVFEVPAGFDEFEEALGLALDEHLLHLAEAPGVEGLLLFEEAAEIEEGEAGGLGGEGGGEAGAGGFVGDGDFDGGGVGAGGDAFVDGRQLFVDDEEGHVEALQMRTGGPVEQGDDLGGGWDGEAAGFASGEQKAGVVDDDGGGDAVGFGGHDVVLDEAVDEREGHGGVAAGSGEVADFAVGEDDHFFEAGGVGAGEGAEAAGEVVVENEVPAAEDLLGEEVGEGGELVAVGDEVLNIAVEGEEDRGAGEVEFGEALGPGGVHRCTWPRS